MLPAMLNSTLKIAHTYRTYRTYRAGGALVAALSLVGGCAYGQSQQVVRAQFASELECPDATAKARPVYAEGYKKGQYTVTGCGVVRTYSCEASDKLRSYDDQCSYVAGDMTVPMAKPVSVTGAPSDDGAGAAPMDEPQPEAAPAPEPAKPAKPAVKPAAKPSPFKAAGKVSTKIGK